MTLLYNTYNILLHTSYSSEIFPERHFSITKFACMIFQLYCRTWNEETFVPKPKIRIQIPYEIFLFIHLALGSAKKGMKIHLNTFGVKLHVFIPRNSDSRW